MRPHPGEVLHFSQDQHIEVFRPHVASTAASPGSYVWAVDGDRSPAYWFPRQCPRAMAWTVDGTTEADAERIIGPGGGTRVHAVEYGWLDAMRTVELYAYRLPAAEFRPVDEKDPHSLVATTDVAPLARPELVGNLFDVHAAADIQLRVLPSLHQFWDAVIVSTLGFSGIRLRNAAPRTYPSRSARPAARQNWAPRPYP